MKAMMERTPDWQAAEFRWYRKHGRYVDRCRIDFTGKPYVIGDLDWNKRNPDRPEVVEPEMHKAIFDSFPLYGTAWHDE